MFSKIKYSQWFFGITEATNFYFTTLIFLFFILLTQVLKVSNGFSETANRRRTDNTRDNFGVINEKYKMSYCPNII
jgi:hypothetical protein